MRDPVSTGAATRDEEKFCMVNHLVLDMGLTPAALALYVIFLKYADNSSGQAFPSRGTMASMIGASERTVDKYIKELEDKGLVKSFPRWRNTDGKVSAESSKEFNAQTSNGYVVIGHAGVRKLCDPPLAKSARPPSQDLRTNYTHNELDPVELYPPYNPPKGETKKRATRIEDGWIPSQQVIDTIRAEHPGLNLESEHKIFMDYWLSAPDSKARKVDWDATWRGWMRRNGSKVTGGAPSRKTQLADVLAASVASSTSREISEIGQREIEGF